MDILYYKSFNAAGYGGERGAGGAAGGAGHGSHSAVQETPGPGMTVAPVGSQTCVDLYCTVKGQQSRQAISQLLIGPFAVL